MKYTTIQEAASNKNKLMVKFNPEYFPSDKFRGSLNVFGARVLGLGYADYLKMLRDKYNAEIVGKGTLYPVPLFKNQNDAIKVQAMLEARIKEILE